VNIVGTDGNGHEYTGDSVLLDCAGQEILAPKDQKGTFTTEFSLDYLQKYRRELPFLNDADDFVLNL
jgi:omega-amidase